MSTAAPATAAAWALAGALYRVANHTEVPEATLLNLCWNLVHLWTIQKNSKATCGWLVLSHTASTSKWTPI